MRPDAGNMPAAPPGEKKDGDGKGGMAFPPDHVAGVLPCLKEAGENPCDFDRVMVY